jgi:ribosomal protein L37AE/L43A
MFFAFATPFPNFQVLLFFILPVKMKWLAYIDAALFLWSILGGALNGDLVAALLPVVAILNYLIYFFSDLTSFLGMAKHRYNRQTVNFKQAAKKKQQQKGYLHKCTVCGRTDTDNPGLEFRYCSKCNGYYCYCMDHINDHVHIK